MVLKELGKVISGLVADLKPAPEVPAGADLLNKSMTFDRSEKDNSKWIELISGYLATAKTFEIHCWNEETEWIELALQYGKLKDDDWKYGKPLRVMPLHLLLWIALHRRYLPWSIV